MSKKSKIKFAVKKAMKPYYKSGFTCLADNVKRDILKEINKVFAQKHLN